MSHLKLIFLGILIALIVLELAIFSEAYWHIETHAKIKNSLAVGTKFPDFTVQDVTGQPLSVVTDKGKLILIDFWATWCTPCVAELPNLEKTYAKYHNQGFDIIGVSVDADKNKLADFLKARSQDMPWPEYFHDNGLPQSKIISISWPGQNDLAAKCGVDAIPSNFLIDHQGTILAVDLRGDDLEPAVANALRKINEAK